MEQTPHGTPEQPQKGFCALSSFIIVIGGLSMIVGFVASKEYDTPLFLGAGALSCLWSVALAVIVDACDRYRKNH